jgi:hypothetical protein
MKIRSAISTVPRHRGFASGYRRPVFAGHGTRFVDEMPSDILEYAPMIG